MAFACLVRGRFRPGVADGDGDNFMSSTASPSSLPSESSVSKRRRSGDACICGSCGSTPAFSNIFRDAKSICWRICDVLLTMRASFCLARSLLDSSVSLFPLVSRSRDSASSPLILWPSSMLDWKARSRNQNTPCLVSAFPISTWQIKISKYQNINNQQRRFANRPLSIYSPFFCVEKKSKTNPKPKDT